MLEPKSRRYMAELTYDIRMTPKDEDTITSLMAAMFPVHGSSYSGMDWYHEGPENHPSTWIQVWSWSYEELLQLLRFLTGQVRVLRGIE